MEAERIEWFDDRFYKVGNDFYPSITTVLGIIEKSFLKTWYGDIGTERAQYRSRMAMEKGSRIHQGIYDLLQKGYVSGENYPQEDYYQIWNFLKFYESLNPVLLANEVIVLDHDVKSAGTLDLLINVKEGVYDIGYSKTEKLSGNYLIDVKTGNMDLAYHYQTAAYADMAVKCNLCESIDGTGILLTKADTKKGWKLILRSKDEMTNDYKHFLSALDLFNAKDEVRPKVFDMPATLEIASILQTNNKEL